MGGVGEDLSWYNLSTILVLVFRVIFKILFQLTSSTHFLDASNVYGTDTKSAENLREMKGGRLRAIECHGEWPPNKEKCPAKNQNVCFMTGDPIRNDQTLGLASIHVIMLREHNRVARKLEELNPHWSDEMLYQEARRIVIAEQQHITYNEWIPKHIGKDNRRSMPEITGQF